MDTPLCHAIAKVVQQNRIRLHVPFHAGRAFASAPFSVWDTSIDLTELPPLDVLGNPEGVLKTSQDEVAALYGVQKSFYLVNGASVGLMATMLALGLSENDTVLVARNAHRSVVHGLVLCGAQPQWLLPTPHSDWGIWGSLTVEATEAAIQASPQSPKALIMTHPTYEGLPSDIPALAKLCQQYNMVLIVDEAHGALWPLFDSLPSSAVTSGADAVVHSLHKSGGSLTQGALLHLPKDSKIASESVQEALNLLQTTSPSYPLLTNMEATLSYWSSPEGCQHLNDWQREIQLFRNWIHRSLNNVQLFNAFNTPDMAGFQLLLKHTALNGEDFATRLEEEYDLAFESYNSQSVLLNLNAGLNKDALSRLKTALLELNAITETEPITDEMSFSLPDMAMTPRQAWFQSSETLSSKQAIGRISRQVVATCPPGIPILMPGEVIQAHQMPYLPETILVTR